MRPVSPKKRFSVTLRQEMIDRLRIAAEAKGWPLRTLVWLWLHQRLQEEEDHQEMQGRSNRPIRKTDILSTIEALPADATLDDAAQRLKLLARLERGLVDEADGKIMPHEEVVRQVKQQFK